MLEISELGNRNYCDTVTIRIGLLRYYPGGRKEKRSDICVLCHLIWIKRLCISNELFSEMIY